MEKTFTIFYYPDETEYAKLNVYFTLIHLSDTAIYVAELVFNESKHVPDDDKINVTFFAVFNNYGDYESQITLRGNVDADAFAEVYKSSKKNEYILAVYSFELDQMKQKAL